MPFPSKNTTQNLTPDEALAKLEHFCAYRERCPREVREKIAELGMTGQTADQLYQVLEADGFFNEERFALAFAGGKFRVNHWGRVRIRLELQRRAISPAIIRKAIDSIDETEYRTVLNHLIGQKRRQNRSADPRQLSQKIANAVIRAGFEPELVFQLV